MDTTAIGAAVPGATSKNERGLTGMSSEAFFELLVTELQQQDPLEPTDTADIVGQVAQIRNIEMSSSLTDTLEQLTQRQTTNGVAELLGKHVTVQSKTSDGETATTEGVVMGVRFSADGQSLLELDTGQTVLASDVVRVTTLEVVEAEQAAAAALNQGEDDEENAASDTAKAANAKAKSATSSPLLDLVNGLLGLQ